MLKLETKNNSSISTNYFFLVDLSGSMYDNIEEMKNIMFKLYENINQNDTMSLAYFSGYNEYEWIFKFSVMKNIKDIIQNKFYARGLTCYEQIFNNLESVILDAKDLFPQNENVLFFLSDGYPNDKTDLENVLNSCKNISKHFSISNICGFGNYYGRELLNKMANSLSGQFIHSEEIIGVDIQCNNLLSINKKITNININKFYTYVWQVTNNDIFIHKCNENGDISVIDVESELYYLNEWDKNESSDSPKFIYSFAYVLSKLDKCNIAIQFLNHMKCLEEAEKLRKAFTVSQKGQMENLLKEKALFDKELVITNKKSFINLKDFIQKIELKKTKIEDFEYTKTTKSYEKKNNVKIRYLDKGIIQDIIMNEKRPNLSFQVLYPIEIYEIIDEELLKTIENYNLKNENKIILPIKTSMYKNYSFISNGNFSFKKIQLDNKIYYPDDDIEIFNEEVKEINIEKFYQLSKELIFNKAKLSVCSLYLNKTNEDERIKRYSEESISIFKNIGIDSKFKYSKPRIENTIKKVDYITYQSITSYLKGCSSISAKKTYEKFISGNNKYTSSDKICLEYIKEYENKKLILEKELFNEKIKNEIIYLNKMIMITKNSLSNMKFYMMMTNSWFEGINKDDNFEYKDMVIKVNYEKEYL